MSEDAGPSRVFLWALLAVMGLVVVVALIVVFARGGTTQFDPETPEGVVQRYAQAVSDGDVRTALTYLAPEIADSCERVHPGTEDHRMTLVDTTERDGTARVEVIVATIYGSGPLGADEYQSEEAFDLVREDGSWFIETAPWQFTVCIESGQR
ncbi:DUF4878 domain-containing protein [Microbacterium cremeum]|uniref:DUF4878 domain-containing protein n=1 Tax=Microbacterium cremeum TaxID=2782169 RepID=UPI0018891E3A|nr:DUF4878 domain-containing protein [Microbacterium cremeum]